MSAAALALVLIPLLMRWTYRLANRPSEIEDKFLPSPPLRALYPGGLIMFGWVTAFEGTNVFASGGRWNWGDALGLTIGIGALVMTIVSWPVTVEVSADRLTWHHLVQRHSASWNEVEDVNTDMSNGLVIYLTNNRRIEVGPYTQGRPELKQYILRRLGRPDNG